jgi:leader peptidase (prepilin peptidase)/N-methyltransferase
VLGLRLPAGRPVVIARSACDHCGAALSPFELVPVVSFVMQRGRCRRCAGRIDPIHLVAEIAAIVLAVSAAGVFAGPAIWIACGLAWTLLALAVADSHFGLLPDVLTLPLLPAGLLAAWWSGDDWLLLDRVVGAILAFGLLAAVGWAYRRWRGRLGLGFGDVKLIAAGGAWIGWQGVPSVLLIAAGGALLAVAALLIAGRWNWRRRLAFGPWLAVAIWLVYLFGPLRFHG